MKASVVSLLAWVLVPFLALAQGQADLNTITAVRVNGGTVEITGTKKPNFTTFTMTDPPRLVIDISEAVFAGVPEDIAVGNGTVTGIRTASYGSDQNAIARVLIGYEREVETDIAASGNALVVKVVGSTGPMVAEAPRPAAPQQGDAAAEPTATPTPGTGAAQATVAADDERQAQQKAAAEAAAAAQADRGAQEKAAAEAAAAARLAAEEEKTRQAEAERVAAESRRQAEAEAARAAAEEKQRQEAEARAAAAAEKKRQEDEARAAAEAKKQAEAEERERRRQEALAAAEARRQAEEDARERRRQEAAATAEEKQRRQEEARAAAEAKKQAEADARAMAAADRRRQRQEAAEARKQAEAEERERRREEARAAAEARRPRVAQAEPRESQTVDSSDDDLRVSSRRKTLTLVGFQQQPSTSRVFVRTNEPVRYSVSEGSRQVVLELENTRIDLSNNTHPLDTSFFETAVSRVDPEAGGGAARIVIQLKEQVPFRTRQEGNVISLEFQRPSR